MISIREDIKVYPSLVAAVRECYYYDIDTPGLSVFWSAQEPYSLFFHAMMEQLLK